MSKSKDIYAVPIDFMFPFVLGAIFDKPVPVLEASERKWLKAGVVTHCANLISIVGLLTLGFLPKPDLPVTTGYLCETAPKTLGHLHEVYNIPVCYADTCTDRAFRENLGHKNRISKSGSSGPGFLQKSYFSSPLYPSLSDNSTAHSFK